MKHKTVFSCQECGAQAPKWMGKCPDCGAWNSLVEETAPGKASGGSAGGSRLGSSAKPVLLGQVDEDRLPRRTLGAEGIDRVLGGGVVPGSLVLIGGEPGAGKSTLMLQVAEMASAMGDVLYVSGEESVGQVRMRADRLKLAAANIYIHGETQLEQIIDTAASRKPSLMIVDSVQTVFSSQITSSPGSVSQVREVAGSLLVFAKRHGIPVFLVGHVNKAGQLAGPKTMEHIVDTVIMLEGDRFHSMRLMRALKNRFGPVSEIAVYEMTGGGLMEVPNPSELFLAERAADVAGSAVVATLEGTRPLLVEVQALVSQTAYGAGRRTAEGFDQNRLALLIAILERRGGLSLSDADVFVNVVGGVNLKEPAADLAVSMAIASSLLNKPLPRSAVFFGELGLGGEVRSVSAGRIRCKEAESLGLRTIFMPKGSRKDAPEKGLDIHLLSSIGHALEDVFS